MAAQKVEIETMEQEFEEKKSVTSNYTGKRKIKPNLSINHEMPEEDDTKGESLANQLSLPKSRAHNAGAVGGLGGTGQKQSNMNNSITGLD